MDQNKLRLLAGLPRIVESKPVMKEEASNPSFGLESEENVKVACLAIAKAGVAVDMEFFMDVFYFNFKSKKEFDKAVNAVKAAKVDISKEDHFVAEGESKYDPKATEVEARRIAAYLKKQFNVALDTQNGADGSVTFKLNDNAVATHDANNPNVFSAKNLSAAIDADYYEFRKKGWFFGQPSGGTFTIGVPAK